MSKINSDFLKKTINELITTRKQRKFLETVELQIGLRDYDPDKRFNGVVRLPFQAYSHLKVPPSLPRFASSPTPHTLRKPLQTTSPTSMLRVSRPSIRTRPKSKSGPRSTTSFWPATQLESKSPSFWATFWSRWVSTPSSSLRERRSSQRLINSNTPSSSSPRRLPASEPPSETSTSLRTRSDKT